MLIRAPHAEKEEGEIILFSICLSTHQESAAICLLPQPPPPPPPPLHLLIFPSSPTSLILSIRPLCVLQSLQQSAHLENPQLPSSISSAHISHTHTHTHTHKPPNTLPHQHTCTNPQTHTLKKKIKNIPLYKGAIKNHVFPTRLLFEETGD